MTDHRSKENGQITVLYIETCRDGTIGGTHTSLLNLIRGLTPSKYRPVVIFYERNRLQREFLAAGAEVHVLKAPYVMTFRLSRRFPQTEGLRRTILRSLDLPVAFFCKAFNLLYSSLYCGVVESCWFLLKNGVDIVHLNNGFLASREWAIAAKMLGIRCVSNLMGFAKGSIQSRFTAKLLDAVMPCSEAVKQDMIEKGINCRRNVVVYLAIPDAFFGSWPGTIERVEGRLPEKGPSIGIIGNIKPWKGQRVVIEALALLKSKYPTLRCLFVGDTPRNANGYLEEIKAFIAENGLEENAVFMGYQRDIPKIVAEIDIVVHASIEPEPLGLVIIEGMAMGKAVIATDIGGPREIIMSGETGLLVSPNNPRELAAAIEHLLSDPIKAKEMGKRARQDAETRFRVGEYARQIERVYEDVLSSNRVARFQGGIG